MGAAKPTLRAMRAACFPPVVDPHTRLLLLGSLPGRASLAAGRYYAHPRNLFWRLAGEALGVDLVALDYDARLAALRARGVGLWDVIADADRPGSLDAAIRAASANDLAALCRTLPRLAAVAFNGATAARIGRARLAGVLHLRLIDLPSSSPAYAALPYPAKRDRWAVIAGLAAPPASPAGGNGRGDEAEAHR